MSLIQETLDKSLPYGRVFQGSGEQDVNDKECRFYQHGLYFDAKGKVLLNSPHNAAKLAQLRALEPNEVDPDNIPPEALTVTREPVNPKIMEAFQSKSDEDILAAALRMKEFNKEHGVADDYEPTLDARGDNIRFIAKHAG